MRTAGSERVGTLHEIGISNRSLVHVLIPANMLEDDVADGDGDGERTNVAGRRAEVKLRPGERIGYLENILEKAEMSTARSAASWLFSCAVY